MSQFDQSKWRKNQLLQEAGLLESIADQAAKAIDTAIASVDESLSYKDFALAVAKILKDEYGAHNFNKFMEILHAELGINESLNEAKELSSYKIGDKVEFPNGEIWKVAKPGVKYDKVFLAPFNDIAKKGHISVAIEFTADELKDAVSESLNEAKDEYYPDSPEALRQATQTAKEILDKHKESIRTIANKYEGQPGKSREMQDELNALIDADLEGVPFEEYVSDKVKGTLGKALFRYYASKNPELSKLMK